MIPKNHLALLGFKVRDAVTGFTGVVSSISFDLYGCVQAIVTPTQKDGKCEDSKWFDTKRLKPISSKPVMEVPTFDVVPGPEAKPAFASHPMP